MAGRLFLSLARVTGPDFAGETCYTGETVIVLDTEIGPDALVTVQYDSTTDLIFPLSSLQFLAQAQTQPMEAS